MKKHILAAVFVALSATAFAERPSSDELAIRLGVREWFSARSSSTGQFNFSKLQAIYRPDLEFTDPATGKSMTTRGLVAYTAILQSLVEQVQKFEAKPGDDVSVALNGSNATSSFTFRPQSIYKDGRAVTCGARVSLTWERHDGLWQIAREEIAPLAPQVPAELATAK
jgi:ketosteroid isomerase-like protein